MTKPNGNKKREGTLTIIVSMKPEQTKHIGKAIAILAPVVSGHSPQSAGHVEQPSSSSQKPSPHTGQKEGDIRILEKKLSSELRCEFIHKNRWLLIRGCLCKVRE